MVFKKVILDLSKYGFALYREHEDIYEYHRGLDDMLIAKLTVLGNIYSLSYFSKGKPHQEIKVANRYVCDNENELAYIILKGRIGGFFTSGISANKAA